MKDGAIIEAAELRRSFGAVEAVGGVSFAVGAGEVFGLLGPNGAGKTTTLRMLATLLQPSGGVARIAGIDVREDPLAVRRLLGYLTGDTGLYGKLTPVRLLRFFGSLYGLPRKMVDERIEALLDTLEIRRFAGRRCGRLSTGEKQRVSIARALLHDPPVLILDEPTSGLDIVAAQHILDLFRAERDRGKALLFSTHVMAEAELLCDRVAIIHRGQIVETGTVEEIRARHDEPTLAGAFLRAIAGVDPGAGGDAP